MKKFIFFALTLILCEKAIANGISKRCEANEVYTTCGTACPLTCDNYQKPPLVCTKQCVIGCVCKEGYVKDCDGNCVLPCDCKGNNHCSGKFEEYNPCGSACPLTCDNYNNPPACTRQCVPGCYCKPGYVRNKAGNCVTPCQCPQVCPLNEVYNDCGTACPLTCDNYKNPPQFCTQQCVKGCECKKGYVRDKKTGACILPCDCPACPPTCPLNEVYNDCGTACPLTCDNHKNPPMFCTEQCVKGCECKKGYVRDKKTGACILPCDCPVTCDCTARPPICPLNEVYNDCGTACPLTCDNYNNPPKFCTLQCVKGCECKKGYVRDKKTGACILPCDCPAPCDCTDKPSKCLLKNEVYSTCGTACPRTCENYYQKDRLCTQQCVEGCFCEPNYVRNKKGYCVLPSQC